MVDLVLEGRTALVVEDDGDYAAFLEAALRQIGLGVTVAHDGIQAMKMAEADVPDVVTLDIQMPRETGIMFYRRARSTPSLRAMPVIVVTGITPGDPDMNILVRSMLHTEKVPPPDDFLEKPVTVRGLEECVVNVIRAAQGASRR